MRQCSSCASEQAEYVDTLLRTGSSLRAVSRNTGFSRATVGRHKQHAQVAGPRLGPIRNEGGPDGTDGPLDPLPAALELSRRARTDRELLKAAEAIRGATALKMKAFRGVDLDRDMLEQLEQNIAEAAALYRRVGGFENELRALAGHREAVRQRLEALKAEEIFEVAVVIATHDGRPVPLPEPAAGAKRRPATSKVPAAQYWAGIPVRFRDPERYVVQRTIQLHFGTSSKQEIKVYEIETGALVWRGENVEGG